MCWQKSMGLPVELSVVLLDCEDSSQETFVVWVRDLTLLQMEEKLVSLLLKFMISINNSEYYVTESLFLSFLETSLLLDFSTSIQLSLMQKHYLPFITNHTLFSSSCLVIFLKRKHAVSFVQGTVAK